MTRIVIKPKTASLVMLGIVCLPLVAVGVDGFVFLRTPILGSFFTLVGVYIWLYLATIRIWVGEDISYRRFWRTEWSIPIDQAASKHGAEAKALFLPGLLIYDKRKPHVVHGLGYAQFRKADLDLISLSVQH